jgi:hypothetical protein
MPHYRPGNGVCNRLERISVVAQSWAWIDFNVDLQSGEQDMELSDVLTIGIVVFVGILLCLGALKWLLKLSNGLLALALMVLGLALLARWEPVDRLTRGMFREATLLQRTARVWDSAVQQSEPHPLYDLRDHLERWLRDESALRRLAKPRLDWRPIHCGRLPRELFPGFTDRPGIPLELPGRSDPEAATTN